MTDVRERRVLAEQHHLGADHVRDVVLDRPTRAGRSAPSTGPRSGRRTAGRRRPTRRRAAGSAARSCLNLGTYATPATHGAPSTRYDAPCVGRLADMATRAVERVQWFFDPMCPYAYQASRWIRDVRTQTPLDITWRFFSLEDINREDGKKHPWERPWSYGWGQMRVGALIRRELGNDAVDRWYETVGHAFFDEGVKTHDPEGARGGDRGGRASTRHSSNAPSRDPTTTDDVRADHDEVVARPRRPRCADDRVRVGLRRVRAGRRARADGRRRARTVGPRARHAAVPAPLRAPAPEDGRRSPPHRDRVPTPTSRLATWKTIEKPAL